MGISSGKWKYIQAPRPELYDVISDPGETNNLVGQEPQRARILEDKLREILERSVSKDPDSRMELDPESIKRLESLGYVAGKAGEDLDFDKSKKDPKDLVYLSVQFQKAVSLSDRKELDKSKKVLLDLIDHHPQFHEIYLLLGTIEMQQGHYDKAILHYRKLIELQPNDSVAFSSLSGALYQTGEYKQAIEHARTAIRIDPEAVDAYVNLALAYEKDGDRDHAADTYLKALQLSPNNAKVCNSLANIYIAQEKFDQCLIYHRRSIKINPNQPAILNYLAWLQATNPSLQSRNIDEAIICAQRLCKLTNFKHPLALDTLAVAYAAAGEFPKAVKTAQRAIDIAMAANNTTLAQKIAAQQELFKQSKPYTGPALQ